MRRRQFVQLIYDLRAELERSADPAVGVSDLQSLKRHLQRTYETIYDDYDWPHLRVTASLDLGEGERYYDVPSEIDYDKLEEIKLFWSGIPTDIPRGICLDDYAAWNSDDDERSDPVQKWDIRFVDTLEMIEVWPIPNTTGDSIKFIGKKKFVQLIDDADRCLVDDHLVILSAAVELLPEKSAGKVRAKLAALQSRYGRVKGRAKAASGPVRIGLGSTPTRQGFVLRVRG